jgi:glycyl-tRNA synthetase beta chain
VKKDLLIEVGVEELPSLYVKPAIEFFHVQMGERIKERNIDFSNSECFSTPRRLAILIRGINEEEKVVPKRVFGPPAENGFDEKGRPTDAAKGFVRSHKKTVKELKIGERKGRKFCCLDISEDPKKTDLIVKEILPSLLTEIPFTRKMRWEESGFEFARPIRWLVVLMGRKVIGLEVAGIESGNKTFGPRFRGAKQIVIKDASSYVSVMKKNGIIPSFSERKGMVERGISELLEKGEEVFEDPGLLVEVTNLVEYPSVFKGTFGKDFLSLPQDVLITAMREHQRYFSIIDRKEKILSSYIGVANTTSETIPEITKNNNNVLKARLEDAKFYWNEDLKKPLAEMIDELKTIEWHRGLGTLHDKTNRLVNLSIFFCGCVKNCDKKTVERGAFLSKADQVTNMVKDGKEFTKLEGIIGREYALQSNERKEVAIVISDHYLPRFPEDKLPSTLESAIVGMCDRIDTLVGNFLIGQIPSGGGDPFGLRRCMNGFIRIVDEFKLRFSFSKLVKESIAQYSSQKRIEIKRKEEEVVGKVKEFLQNRLSTYFSTIGIRYDIADAVFSIHSDDIFDAMSRIRTLNDERESEGFEELIIGQRRVSNILKDLTIVEKQVRESLFDCTAETVLWEKYAKSEERFSEEMKMNRYRKALKELLSLRPFINEFFDSCLVMDKDEEKKNNRLALLTRIKELFDQYADFSIIVLEGEREKEKSG